MLIEVHFIIVDYVCAYNILIAFNKNFTIKASHDHSHEAYLLIIYAYSYFYVLIFMKK